MSRVRLVSFESRGKVRIVKVAGTASLQPDRKLGICQTSVLPINSCDAYSACNNSVFMLA